MINLAAAIQAHKPVLVLEFKRMVENEHDRLYKQYGPKLRRVQSRFYFETVSPCCVNVDDEGKPTDRPAKTVARILDKVRLDVAARNFADDVAANWVDKIRFKLGALDSYSVTKLDHTGRLCIAGKRGAHDVRLEQQRILKCSSRGTLFHQFPARLYVDGTFTPEADFAEAIR